MSSTYSELWDNAMKCRTRAQGDAFIEKEAKLIMRRNKSCKDIEKTKSILRSNLGYYAGYYGAKEANKVHKIFGAVHPIFGSSTYHKDVSPKQALEAGKKLAKKKKK